MLLGIGSFVAIVGISQTASGQIGKQFDVLQATTAYVFDVGAAQSSTPAVDFPPDADALADRIRGVVAAGVYWPVQFNQAPVSAYASGFLASARGMPVTAASPGLLAAAGVKLAAGRAYAEALFGFGPGAGAGPGGHLGCMQQASKEVYGPITGEPVPDPVPQIAGQAVSFTQSDPRIRAVDRAWSRCMARHFYHYSTPAQVEGHSWKSPPNKAEIATTVADVACQTQVNLLNTWLAVEAAYQQALIGRNLATLSQLQASFAPLLRRANAGLSAATGTGGA